MTPTPFPSPTPSPLPPLEILQRAPAGEARPGTLLFVHGAFSGAWCWDVHFLPYFAAAGYRCLAVSLRGHGNSPGRHTLAWHTMADYVADVACAAANLPRPLVLIGHSMGGFVIQKYLEKHPLPQAVVLLASVAPWGLWPSSLNLALKDPELFQQLQLLQWWGPTWVSRAYARRALFSEELPEADVVRFTELSQRESVQALLDMAWDLPRQTPQVPALVVGGENDALIPVADVRATAAAFATAPMWVEDVAHALMLDRHWRRVADGICHWLQQRDL